MIVSYKELNKYVDLSSVNAYELQDVLTNAGLEVETVTSFAQGSDLVIGYVKECQKHPDSDKLSVCQVDIKDEVVQICCGAANVGAGMYVIVAKVGCKLDYAKVPVIKNVSLGGVESNGMICSLSELGISTKFQTQEQIDGIEALYGDYTIGEEALSALGFDDYILDISLTPNRSDGYSIYALAIEVAGLLNTKVKPVKMNVDVTKESKYTIKIENDACSSYGLFVYNNIQSEKSNQETINTLMALGFKSRFNIVDSGNLGMVISGNPIHTFDADKLNSDIFTIKKGLEKTDFLALDDKLYTITKDDLLIMNGDDIVAIAGVIGSKSSCIDENTKNLVVESAAFDHVSIRNTARRLNLFSEASTRYSKIVNPYTLEFPVALLEDYLNIKCGSATRVGYLEYIPKQVKLKHSKVERLLGIKIDINECVTILERLSFKVTLEDDVIVASVPSYRKDVSIAEDIIEEIIRVYGYDKIATSLPLQEIKYTDYTPIQSLENNTKDILVGMSLQEIITYQLENETNLNNFSENEDYLRLENPISKDRTCFRNQLLSSMMDTITYNKSYQHHNQSLFEISHVYHDGVEKTNLAIGLSGLYFENSWHQAGVTSDFYLLKGIIFSWLEKIGFAYGRISIKPIEPNHKFFHPTKAAYLVLNNKNIGIFGEIHPTVALKYKVKNTYLASIDLSVLSANVGRANKYEKLNLLPSVHRDLSLVVPNEISSQEIIKIVKTGNNKLVKDVKVFDVYRDKALMPESYSISITIEISDATKTLDETTINSVINNILANLDSKLNIKIRS